MELLYRGHSSLLAPHAGRRARRVRGGRICAPTGGCSPQQLREPRLPGLARGRRARVVAKFYRPGRWSDAQIDEEHAFAPSSPSARSRSSRRSHSRASFGRLPLRRLSAPRRARARARGRETLEWIGRFIGRIHAVGATKTFKHRASADAEDASATSRAPSCSRTTSSRPICSRPGRRSPSRRSPASTRCFERAATVQAASACTATATPATSCGPTDGPHFVDLDDARMGPAMQDLWMLLSGDRAAMRCQLREVLAGYEEFMRVRPARAELARGAAHAAPASTTRRGSRAAGTIPLSRRRSRGSTRSATGRTGSSSCASRSR